TDYVKSISEFKFIEGSLEALRRLSKFGYPIIVITNQSVVGRGIISEADLIKIHSYMSSRVREEGSEIQAIFYCPHRPDQNCECRKPKTLLFKQAEEKFQISLKDSWFIGDKPSDEEAGRAAGCKTVIVDSNKPNALLGAASRIVSQYQEKVA
ncbi:MAG: HAD family hydrolase, partial [Nitrososphaerota archaeon]|nr:HAD family hydrolase [Nitrososphaerota archaeon]